MSSAVRIVEVGPRDGLQNERGAIPTEAKLRLILALVESGLVEIEATSFVSPRWVPQLADSDVLWPLLPETASFSAVIPNLKGLERALSHDVKRIAVLTATSESFTQHNTNMSVEESLRQCERVIEAFRTRQPRGWVRGYISTAFECPYEGRQTPEKAAVLAQRLFESGVNEISVADTIGVAVPREVESLARILSDTVPLNQIAFHFHDTRGTAIANVSKALELGIRTFDSSAGGLGGCPYAPGAGGNLATEDLVYFLERSGLPTGVNLSRLAPATLEVLELAERSPSAKSQLAAFAASGTFPKQTR